MSYPLVKLGDYVEILSGFAFKSELFSDKENGLPLVRIRDVVRGISKTYYLGDYSDEYVVNDGDLLIGMDGDFNRKKWQGGKALLNQRVCKITADGIMLNQEYLYHLLQKKLDAIHFVTSAVTVKHLSVKGIKDIEIPLPPLDEQKRIAAILDKADNLRRKRQQAIQLADEFLRAVFLDLFGDPVTNPKGWETVPVSHFVNEFQGGKSLVEKGDDDFKSKYRVLKISAVTWKTFNPAESKPLPDNYEPNTEHFVKKHDLLFSRANTTELVAATSYVFETPDNILLPDKIWRFVWKNEIEVAPLFIWHLFWDSGIRYQLGNLATGSGGSMKNISKAKLMQFKVIFPPYELQKKFALKLERIMELQRKMAKKDEYNLLFNSLSQKAFAGEL